jgi:hypothetical protein
MNLTESPIAQPVKRRAEEVRGQYDPIKGAIWYIR